MKRKRESDCERDGEGGREAGRQGGREGWRGGEEEEGLFLAVSVQFLKGVREYRRPYVISMAPGTGTKRFGPRACGCGCVWAGGAQQAFG